MMIYWSVFSGVTSCSLRPVLGVPVKRTDVNISFKAACFVPKKANLRMAPGCLCRNMWSLQADPDWLYMWEGGGLGRSGQLSSVFPQRGNLSINANPGWSLWPATLFHFCMASALSLFGRVPASACSLPCISCTVYPARFNFHWFGGGGGGVPRRCRGASISWDISFKLRGFCKVF